MRSSITILAALTLLTQTAHALGAGEFCFFLAPNDANNFGHIAWGFEVPGVTNGVQNLYMFGGTEDVTLDSIWNAHGSRADMISYFKNKKGKIGVYGNNYGSYKCLRTQTSAVGSAEAEMKRQLLSSNVYELLTNNCLHQSLRIARDYAETDVYYKIENLIQDSGTALGLLAAYVPNAFWVFVPVSAISL